MDSHLDPGRPVLVCGVDMSERPVPSPQVVRHYRQGDVLLLEIDRIAAGARTYEAARGGRLVLALGEATGHAHAIADGGSARLWRQPTGRYLEVAAAVDLVHEEHATVTVAPGTYVVRIQREYVPPQTRGVRTFGMGASRPVRD